MTDIHEIGPAAQSLPPAANAVADFGDAMRNAHFAILNGQLDSAIARLEEASRLADEVRNPHTRELANLASALATALETLKLVEMCFLDLFPVE